MVSHNSHCHEVCAGRDHLPDRSRINTVRGLTPSGLGKGKAIKKKSPDLSLVKNSDDHWTEERDKIIAIMESLSNESLETLSMRLEQLILECKSPSPLRRKARKDRIRTERAGKFRLIQ